MIAKRLWKFLTLYFLLIVLSPCFAMAIEPDGYEDDDEFNRASLIIVGGDSQHHDFHDQGDTDWVIFHAIWGKRYTIKANNLQSRCNVMLELYEMNGKEPPLKGPVNLGLYGQDEYFPWICTDDGFYLIKVIQFEPDVFGKDTEYDVSVFMPAGPAGVADINGVITDACSYEPIAGVKVETNERTVETQSGWLDEEYYPELDGLYLFESHSQGTHTLVAQKDGYVTYLYEIELGEKGQEINIAMFQDANGDGKIDVDINGNDKVEIADAIIILQTLAEVRDISEKNIISLQNVVCILNVLISN